MKKTNWALIIGAIAAVVSAVVLVVIFWDKLTGKCCKAVEAEDEAEPLPEEFADFADVAE